MTSRSRRYFAIRRLLATVPTGRHNSHQKYARSLDAKKQAVLRERLRAELPTAADGSIALEGRLAVVRGTT